MNKQKTLRNLLLISLFFSAVSVNSQTRIWSPYSRYGIGELNFSNSTYISSMGGTSFGFRNPHTINFVNPASYSGIGSRSFLFDGGALFSPRILATEDASETTFFSSLSHITFAFPITTKWGFSFGLVPYSSIGYKINTSESIDSIGNVNYTYEGWGGLNSFYAGTAYELFKGFSVGMNMNYYFGNIERKRIAIFDSTGFTNSRITNKINVSDIHLVAGLQYQIHLKNKTEEKPGYLITLGLSGGNTTLLNASQNILAVHFAGTNVFAAAQDTILNIAGEKSEIEFPLHVGGGIYFEQEKRWMTGMDVEWQKWSDYTSFGSNDSLTNSIRISAGGGFIPKAKANPNMLNQTHILWGAHFYTNYIELKNTPLNQYGISFGFAMPIRSSNTTLQLSFEIGKTGTKENNLIEETYGKFKLGVSISEKWFYKRKYD
jgi:hypothetical protein